LALCGNGLEQILAVVYANQGVDSGQIVEQLSAQPAGQTTSNHHPSAGACLLVSQGFMNDFIGFLASVSEKTTGIDNDDIGLVLISSNDMASLAKQSQHPLGIDKILSTSEGNKGY
jgi:hypothetical protein